MSIWNALIESVPNNFPAMSQKEELFWDFHQNKVEDQCDVHILKQEVKDKFGKDTNPGTIAKTIRTKYEKVLREFLTRDIVRQYREEIKTREGYRMIWEEVSGLQHGEDVFNAAMIARLHNVGFKPMMKSVKMFYPMSIYRKEGNKKVQKWVFSPDFSEIVEYMMGNFQEMTKAEENLLDKLDIMGMLDKDHKNEFSDQLEAQRKFIAQETGYKNKCPYCEEGFSSNMIMFKHFVDKHIMKPDKPGTPKAKEIDKIQKTSTVTAK